MDNLPTPKRVRTQIFPNMEIVSYNFCNLSVLCLPSADWSFRHHHSAPQFSAVCSPAPYGACYWMTLISGCSSPSGHLLCCCRWLESLTIKSSSMSHIFAFPSVTQGKPFPTTLSTVWWGNKVFPVGMWAFVMPFPPQLYNTTQGVKSVFQRTSSTFKYNLTWRGPVAKAGPHPRHARSDWATLQLSQYLLP